jgi:molecular chaperone DnaJ
MSTQRDYYEVLAVARDASDDHIKKAYRALAMKYHPDRNAGDEDAAVLFKEAAEAYAVLSDPQKRQVYDRYGHAGLESRGAVPDFGNSSFMDLLNALGLGNMFGGGRRGQSGGTALQMTVSVTLEEAYKGGGKQVDITRPVACPTCSGSGMQASSQRTMCVRCAGGGTVSAGFLGFAQECPHCEGTGYRISNPCPTCKGKRQVAQDETIEVPIPVGVYTGLQGRLEMPDSRDELYVVFQVERHPRFVRQEHDLHCEVSVTFTQAALGGKVEVPTLDAEPYLLDLPAGSQSGEQIVLEGLGMPVPARSSRRRSPQRGNLVAHLSVVTPTNLTERQKELLRELERADS